MEDNKYNFWAEQKYTPVKIASFGTKIGGVADLHTQPGRIFMAILYR